MRAFIVAGSPTARPPVGIAPQAGDYVVAADFGAQHASAWGWPLNLVIGDLDSLDEDEARGLLEAGVETIRVSAVKDETDMELALAQAVARAPEQIVICAALGGRTDHLLANVLLLTHHSLRGLDVRIADGGEVVRLAQADAGPRAVEIRGAAGDLVSLLPLGANAEGVATEGLLYPLRTETLVVGEARGISNVMLDDRAAVSLTRGRLLVIYNRMEVT